jgi:sialic acid synthase SpsE
MTSTRLPGKVVKAGKENGKNRIKTNQLHPDLLLELGEEFRAYASNGGNLRIVRPGYGLEPEYYDVLLGKRLTRL